MIRRDLKTPGEPDRWVLFEQTHHAAFAAAMAEGWQSPHLTPLQPRDEVLSAIRHHDDGWYRWEERPQVFRGRPIAFNEMPLDQSLAIWQASITEGATRSALEGYAIAGHFARLLREHDSWRNDASTRPLAIDFLTWADQTMAKLLAEWCPKSSQNVPAIAEHAVTFVRLFDALSLWFLCAERTDPATFVTPGGLPVTFTPISQTEMTVEPWPFLTEDYQLSAAGTTVPMGNYPTWNDLAAANPEKIGYTWQLRPRLSSAKV